MQQCTLTKTQTFTAKAYTPNLVRPRTKLDENQYKVLTELYTKNPNPPLSLRRNLAVSLKLTQRVIQIWFQNRRAKDKTLEEELSESNPKCQDLRTSDSDISNYVQGFSSFSVKDDKRSRSNSTSSENSTNNRDILDSPTSVTSPSLDSSRGNESQTLYSSSLPLAKRSKPSEYWNTTMSCTRYFNY